jgi:hypothetical protein
MGLRLFGSGRRSTLLLSLVAVLALALSGGTLPRAQAQGPSVPGGAVSITFDPRPFNGVLCQYTQYKIFVRAGQVTGKVATPLNANIQVQAALNNVVPSSLDIPEAGLLNNFPFPYNAQETGEETITYQAFLNPTTPSGGVLTGPGTAHPEIAEGSVKLEVKECQYSIFMSFWLDISVTSIMGYMDETPLTRNKDGTYEGDGEFEFQQFVKSGPCGTDFAVIHVPTHITGTVNQDLNLLDLKWEYGKAVNTLDYSCPIKGGGITSANIDVGARLGVTSGRFPLDGGVELYLPAIGGRFLVIVNREVK